MENYENLHRKQEIEGSNETTGELSKYGVGALLLCPTVQFPVRIVILHMIQYTEHRVQA